MGRTWVLLECYKTDRFFQIMLEPPKSDVFNQRIRDSLQKMHHDREYQQREIQRCSCSSWLYVEFIGALFVSVVLGGYIPVLDDNRNRSLVCVDCFWRKPEANRAHHSTLNLPGQWKYPT